MDGKLHVMRRSKQGVDEFFEEALAQANSNEHRDEEASPCKSDLYSTKAKSMVTHIFLVKRLNLNQQRFADSLVANFSRENYG